jgi:UrcA family protein
MHMSISVLTGAVMLSTFCIGAQADAASPDPVIRGRSVVHFADLHIDSEGDAKILLQRIERAASEACGGHPSFETYTTVPDRTFDECRIGTLARAVKKLGAPVVTRIYYESKKRRPIS